LTKSIFYHDSNSHGDREHRGGGGRYGDDDKNSLKTLLSKSNRVTVVGDVY
jgi:hypothetical protein